MPNRRDSDTDAAAKHGLLRKDKVLADAIELALTALAPIAKEAEIGEHLSFEMDGDRLGSHYFACLKPGYRGWRWCATLARVPRSRNATICEVALVPGDGALLAPAWIPWAERLRPSDVGPGDTVPYIHEDDRLQPGPRETGEGSDKRPGPVRVLSQKGREQALTRWRKELRRNTKQESKSEQRHSCADCGFLMRLAGSESKQIGVCANEWSPHDGTVVPLDYYCGAHSETDVQTKESLWSATRPHMDEGALEITERQTAN